MVKEGVSTSFSLRKTLSALYSGGGAEWSGGIIFTAAEGKVNLVKKGEVLGTLEAEEDPVVSFTVDSNCSPEEPLAATCHKSGLVRLWTWRQEGEGKKELKTEVTRTFRSIHTGPISICRLHRLSSGGKLLATGGTDGSVKVWDLTAQYYTHNLRAPGGGVASVITFHPSRLLIYAGFAGGGLFCWDLTTSRLAHTMTAHLSAVTGFAIGKDSSRAVSVGRDSVAVVWDLENEHNKLSTVPVFGSAEGLVLMEDGRAVVAEGSNISVWDLSKAKQEAKVDLGSEITLLREGGPGMVHCANADLNLLSVTVPGLEVKDTVVGNNDEVLDLVYLGAEKSHLVLACNSPALRLYETSSWTCHLASGHKDTVLALAVSQADPDLLASGSKDRQVRVWRLTEGLLTCLLVGSGHTEALGGLAFCPEDPKKLWSVSKDTTLKAWTIGTDLTTTRTEIAHQKDINCVAVSQGGSQALVCTGGQDKLAKLWTGGDLGLVHVLRGHTRGVWTAAFSPADKLVATGSGDSTVRLWSIGEGSCVRMLEGHQASVLRLAWWSGLQLVTASTEGLVKVWWVARQEATATIDTGEEGRVWALAVRPGDNGLLEVTAGQAGGRVTLWADDTVRAEEEKAEDAAKLVVSHQKLSNLLQEKKWGAAVRLALRLSQPFTALKIIKKLGREDLQAAVDSLDSTGLDQLLGYTVKWNSNSRHCAAAQAVLNCILTSRDSDDLIKLPGADTWLAGLIPYTEKHQARLSRLRRKGEFVPYLLHQMKATNLPIDSLALSANRPE